MVGSPSPSPSLAASASASASSAPAPAYVYGPARDSFACPACNGSSIPGALWGCHWHHQYHVIDRYSRDARQAQNRTIDAAEALLAAAPPASRLQDELPAFIAMLKTASLGTAITLNDYLTWRAGPPARREGLEWEHNAWLWEREDLYVMCSSAEARLILQRESPRLPVLVPPDVNFDAARRLDLDAYLAYLLTRENIDVHFYDKEPKDAVIPVRMPSDLAVAAYRAVDGLPCNLLNLGRYKKNPTPSCFVDLPAYSILEDLQEHAISGKKTVKQVSDLSECSAFQICGKRGAYSMPHIDQHGAITCMFCDAGEKFWTLWSGMDVQAVEQWGASEAKTPRGRRPLGLYLSPGTMLIQPAGTVHAPFSLTNVLMSGTMFWDSREMVKILRLAKMAAMYPWVTNEDIAKEFAKKIVMIRKLWDNQHPAWPWRNTPSASLDGDGDVKMETNGSAGAHRKLGIAAETAEDAEQRIEFHRLVDVSGFAVFLLHLAC